MEADVTKTNMEPDIVKNKTPDQVNAEVPSDAEHGAEISEICERLAEKKSLDEGGIFVSKSGLL